MAPGNHTAFFYGTLMHPSILRRVIGHDGVDLEISPALLPEHTRHQVKYADYPGMIPYERTRQLLCIQPPKPDLPPEERVVRGTIVRGLNDKDIKLLDYFEGAEYTREVVQAHPLEAFIPLASSAQDEHIVPQDPEPITQEFLAKLPPAITVETYVWKSPLSELNPQLWEYAEFVRKHAHKWYGGDFDDYIRHDDEQTGETGAVHTREVDGEIVRTEIVDQREGGRTVMTAVEINSRSR